MPEENQFKRNVAYKLRIGDILAGKPNMNGEKFLFLELSGKNIVRVNVIGNIVDKFEREGERKFSSFTLDDGSGQIKLRAFGDDVEIFGEVNQGETLVVIGVLRYWNNEIYISPEIMKIVDPKYLLVRKLEIEKQKGQNSEVPAKEQMVAVKDKILGAIKSAEEDSGIEVDKLVMILRDISPVIIKQEIQKFLEEGIIFEPRPGMVKYLG
ncbi:MAG: OB-fold nucleic acid binding domain-containing protein [Nanoarchaeota archaeon]|nr:OB-fold nucleic acid binding domain-containing protein [Nanoarchaeota archaeon]